MSADARQPDADKAPDSDAAAATFGVMAEFETPEALLYAAERVHHDGYTRWDCYTPFPVHGLDKAMGMSQTKLPIIVLILGLIGCGAGLFLTIWTMSTSVEIVPSFLRGYPFMISGKPYNSLPAFIPVIFELTILLAAFGAFFGMLLMNGLPRFHHPIFKQERFRRATDDRFFVVIEADDALYDPERTPALLEQLGATAVERIEDE